MSYESSDLPATIPGLVLQDAGRFGTLEAIVEGDLAISYSDLANRVAAAARSAIASGLQHGERAGIWAPNIFEWAVCALGVHSAGGVVVPINTRFKGPEARYVLEKSGARILFTVRGFLGADYPAMLCESDSGSPLPALSKIVVLREMDGGLKNEDQLGIPVQSWASYLEQGTVIDPAEAQMRSSAVVAEDLSDIIFTSGTTGKPKGVMATHFQTLKVFNTWADIVGLSQGQRYLVVNPFFHTFGYKAGLIASMVKGATVIPMATLDIETALRVIDEQKVNVLPGPPTLYNMILDYPKRSEFDLSSLELAVTGAAVVPVELIKRMRSELTFSTVLTAYGLTEATGTVTMCRLGDDPETIANTSGRAIPDTEVMVVMPNGSQARTGEPGEVVVRGYNVMKGYLDDPEQTAAAVDADGWLRTGDIGVLDPAGNLRITDRKKDLFIVGGFNAYPAEIENGLMSHPGISQVAVIGIPDDRLGEVGMAFVVPRPGADLDPTEIIDWAKGQMANYKVPRKVVVVDQLPLNASGKVLKGELRDLAAAS